MPNMIWLYRRPILDYWAEHEDSLGAIVTHVLVHEIGHHFGLSDDDMEAIEASVDERSTHWIVAIESFDLQRPAKRRTCDVTLPRKEIPP